MYDHELKIHGDYLAEAATAFHVSQIRATENDPALVGYQWRLSSAHPRVDICDEWARVDLGLGAGVWSKDEVPRGKTHPHCMCYLVPRYKGDFKSGKAQQYG